MENVARPDGSSYLRSSRVIYGAIGWIAPEGQAPVVAALRELLRSLAAGASAESAALHLADGPIRAQAVRAGRLIGEFEAAIQAGSHPVVEVGCRTAAHPDNVGIFSAGPFRCPEAAEVADRTARALRDLLLALGAVDVMCMNVD